MAVEIIIASLSALVLLVSLVALIVDPRRRKPATTSLRDPVDNGNKENKTSNEISEATSVTVLFGTQTGTAEMFSKSLVKKLKENFGSKALIKLVDLGDYNPADLAKENLALFLVATYGEGDPTDNANDFVEWMREETDKDSNLLKGVKFGVFGLGNRQYEQFNAMGKLFDSCLEKYGGERIVCRGEGDDDADIEADFTTWSEKLLMELTKLLGSEEGDGDSSYDEECGLVVTEHGSKHDKASKTNPFELMTGKHPVSEKHPAMCVVKTVRNLYGEEKSGSGDRHACIHVEIDIKNTGQDYQSGDHIGIYPANQDEIVNCLLRKIDADGKKIISLKPGKKAPEGLQSPFDTPLPLHDVLKHYCDITGPLRRSQLASLAQCTKDPSERQQLSLLASTEGNLDFQQRIVEPKATLLDLLDWFPSAKPSISHVLSSLTHRLQPRYYSISSSPKQHGNAVHVTASVVEERISAKRKLSGVCTTWMEQRVSVGHKIPAFIRKSSFRLPEDSLAPVIMIGPGTGLAPFRGFIQERAYIIQKKKGEVGKAILFFGCRRPDVDFMYEDELKSAKDCGAISELFVAFSRLGSKKHYVQHDLDANSSKIWDLLDKEGAYLYVCGDAKGMAKDVHRTLINLIIRHGEMSGSAAEMYVKGLVDKGRYQRDVW